MANTTYPTSRTPARLFHRMTAARAITATAFAVAALTVIGVALAGPARADTKPANPNDPATPVTVSADALPAPQINGVVWTQTIIGNTVFAGGEFTTARPAGVALGGAGTVTRNNILSYNLSTGVLNTTFAPSFNGDIRSIVASSDQKHVYVGGAFTSVNGAGRNHLVELDATTGAVVAGFRASVIGEVDAIALRADKNTLFIGGSFSAADSKVRTRLAALTANAGTLRAWAPKANGTVRALVIDPDYSKVVIGGAFTTLNGFSNPGYGMGAVNPITGSWRPWKADAVLRDAGTQSSVTDLVGDSTGVYGSGYNYTGTGGNFEGTFRADWKTGAITWMEDCHGDSYSLAVTSNAVYVAGHAHYCGNIGGFPEDPSGTRYRAIAFSKNATQKVQQNQQRYYTNFVGEPAPSLLNWYPNFNTGTYTGLTQGPWSVAANSQYVVYGGEFTTVNGTPQQGLVRFAVPSIAPNKSGPIRSGYAFDPTVTSPSAGHAAVSWTANSDMDNADLTYSVYLDGNWATPVYTVTAPSSVWNTPTMTWSDPATYASGSSHSYRLRATDPWGNTVVSDGISVTIS